jgi:hypothetical protein
MAQGLLRRLLPSDVDVVVSEHLHEQLRSALSKTRY